MAIETYGITSTDVYPYLPFNTSSLGANSAVTPDDLTSYIETGASKVTGVLRTVGIAYESLDDNQKGYVLDAIASFAAWKACHKIGHNVGANDSRTAFEAALAELRSTPSSTGASATTTQSNVNTTNPYPRKFGRSGSAW